MSADEPQPYDNQIRLLEQAGYVQVERSGRFEENQRVRHVGEQYPEARKGTAEIVAIFERGKSTVAADVEIIVRRDNPDDLRGPFGYWANYHTVLASR